MSMPEREERKKLWVAEWAVSESFWRDVASQAVGGFIVLGAGAIGAAVLGLIDWTYVLPAVFFLPLLGAWLLAMSLVGRWVRRRIDKLSAGSHSGWWLVLGVLVQVLAQGLTLYAFVVLVYWGVIYLWK
jgi:hypothetical protein